MLETNLKILILSRENFYRKLETIKKNNNLSYVIFLDIMRFTDYWI